VNYAFLQGVLYLLVDIPHRRTLQYGCSVSVTTMREVFYGVISQGVTPYFFMEEKVCSFFGHREIMITEELCATLTTEIEKVVDGGCRTFYFGGYGDFDELCYKTVTGIKNERQDCDIQRVFCVPIEGWLRKKVRYFNSEDYERVIFLEPKFSGWYKSIYYRNLAMIDKSCFVIFYAKECENSGAYKAFKYAIKQKDKMIINLFRE